MDHTNDAFFDNRQNQQHRHEHQGFTGDDVYGFSFLESIAQSGRMPKKNELPEDQRFDGGDSKRRIADTLATQYGSLKQDQRTQADVQISGYNGELP